MTKLCCVLRTRETGGGDEVWRGERVDYWSVLRGVVCCVSPPLQRCPASFRLFGPRPSHPPPPPAAANESKAREARAHCTLALQTRAHCTVCHARASPVCHVRASPVHDRGHSARCGRRRRRGRRQPRHAPPAGMQRRRERGDRCGCAGYSRDVHLGC